MDTLNERDLRRLLNCFTKGEPDQCWDWQGSLTNGYAFFGVNGKSVSGAKLVYDYLIGVPEGRGSLRMLRNCTNSKCVNPSHLEPIYVKTKRRKVKAVKAKECSRCKADLTIEDATYRDGRCKHCQRISMRKHNRLYRTKKKESARLQRIAKIKNWAEKAEEYLNEV
jgi:hypothetical protein